MNSHILEIVPALDAVEVRPARGCGFVGGFVQPSNSNAELEIVQPITFVRRAWR